MHIVMCIKQVPDPQAPAASFSVDVATNTPQWLPPAPPVISTFDTHALEAAVQLKEQHGGRVTVVSLGGPDVEVALRRALAAGADAAIRVDPPTTEAAVGAGLATAAALAAAIRRLEDVDLVLCGRIGADWDLGHVPMMLAELLGLPAASPVTRLEVNGRVMRVERLSDEGYDVLELPLPCLLAVSNEVNVPRYPTVRGVMTAQRQTVPCWSVEELGGVPDEIRAGGARVRLRRLSEPDWGRECEFIEAPTPEHAAQALAEILSAKGVV